MDGLVSLSTGVAYGYSIILVLISLILGTVQGEAFFETPAILLTLVMLGRFLEHHAKAKSTVAVDSLLKLQPQNAILLTLNEKNQVLEERVIHSALLKRKDIIKVGDVYMCVCVYLKICQLYCCYLLFCLLFCLLFFFFPHFIFLFFSIH